MNNHKYSFVFTNLIVVGLFLFTNPFIALLLCAIISSLNFKINYYIFSISFIISWTIYHYMRDFVIHGGDVLPYLVMYYDSINDSIFTIISRFINSPIQNEPLWRLINKLIGSFLDFKPSIFIFIVYLAIFLLVSILGFVVSKQKFAIIIFFMFFLNLGLLYNIFHVWRHTISVLLFLIGIYINKNNNRKILSRLLMYASPLIQLVTLPLIILYELFIILNKSHNITGLSKLYNIGVIIYISLFLLAAFIFEIAFYDTVDIFNLHEFKSHYSISANLGHNINLYSLISPISLMLIYVLYKNRTKLSNNEIFLGLTYCLLIIMLLIVPVFPAVIWGRTFYLLLVGVSIVVGQSFITNFRQTTLIIIAVGCYRFYTFSKDSVTNTFEYLGGGTPFNPYSGIITMIYHQEYFKMINEKKFFTLFYNF